MNHEQVRYYVRSEYREWPSGEYTAYSCKPYRFKLFALIHYWYVSRTRSKLIELHKMIIQDGKKISDAILKKVVNEE